MKKHFWFRRAGFAGPQIGHWIPVTWKGVLFQLVTDIVLVTSILFLQIESTFGRDMYLLILALVALFISYLLHVRYGGYKVQVITKRTSPSEAWFQVIKKSDVHFYWKPLSVKAQVIKYLSQILSFSCILGVVIYATFSLYNGFYNQDAFLNVLFLYGYLPYQVIQSLFGVFAAKRECL